MDAINVLFKNPSLALAGGLVALLIIVWFAARYWSAITTDPKIKDVETPNLTRRSMEALEHMSAETPEEAQLEDEERYNQPAPEGLADDARILEQTEEQEETPPPAAT